MTSPAFLPGARADLLEAAQHYRERSPRIADEFLAEVERSARFVTRHPEASPQVRPDIRKRSLLKYPYSLVYVLEGDGVVVIAVAHHRRRPDYWHSRIR